jgi:L-malate glycosyltransferase
VRWVQSAVTYGHEVHLLVTELPEWPESEDSPPNKVHFIPTDRSLLEKTLGRLLFIWKCRRLIKSLKPDLVHVHYLPSSLNVFGFTSAKRLMISVWGSDIVSPENLINEGCRRYAVQHADCITATSTALGYATYAHGSPQQLRRIPFAIDINRFQPKQVEKRGPGFHIAIVKHLEIIYGIDTFLEAMAHLEPMGLDLHLHLVGRGSQEQALRQQARTLGLQDRVHFHSWIPNHELCDFLNKVHLFAMPSRRESFGVSALEASACGLPVIATRVGGVPEAVIDGKTGTLVEAENIADLAHAIAEYANNPELCRTRGEAGRQFVETDLHPERCATLMNDLQQEIVRS